METLADDDLRGRLRALAAALGVAPAERDDRVQDALTAALQAEPDAPAAYAAGALRKSVLMARRRAAAARRTAHGAADPAFLRHSTEATTLSRAFAGESAALCLAALEQAILWGGAGRTSIVLPAGVPAEVLEAEALPALAYYLAVIAALPVSERHKRRCRARLEALITESLPAVRMEPPHEPLRPIVYFGRAPDPEPALDSEPEPEPEPRGLSAAVALMTRGLRLVALLEVKIDAAVAEALVLSTAVDWWAEHFPT